MRITLLTTLLAALFTTACSSDSDEGPSSVLAEGAVELLPPGTGWRTLGSFTGKAVGAHIWGTASDFSFRAGRGALQKTAKGYELIAEAELNGPGGYLSQTELFAFDASWKPASATRLQELALKGYNEQHYVFRRGLPWGWSAGTVGSVTMFGYGPVGEVSDALAGNVRIETIIERGYDADLSPAGVPYFNVASGWQVFTPLDPTDSSLVQKESKLLYCGHCSAFRPAIDGPVGGSDPFLIGEQLYWPVFGSGSAYTVINPTTGVEEHHPEYKLGILKPQTAPNTAATRPYTYSDEPVLFDSTTTIDLDRYTYFRGASNDKVGFLTWFGKGIATQVVFDPATKTLTERFRDVPIGDLDVSSATAVRFDSHGDVYVLTEQPGASGARDFVVRKIGPAGAKPLGNVLSPRPVDARVDLSIQALFLLEDVPYLVLTANGGAFTEPQLSVLAPTSP